MTNSPTVLVIDDDPNIRESLQMILKDQGYRVIEACNGEMGIGKAVGERPNLIIVDMMMPKVSGFLVIERVKHQHNLPIPIIMLTGNESDQQRSYAEFLGVDAYLNKPVRISQLMEAVERFCPIIPGGISVAGPEPQHLPISW
ncbi:response regulator transcription factor [Zavarzinella formosa]|uniref:response regulator transcription factor n=1 Tax=Zavarzinella formosa TaxID=360055 RepID=UPI0012FC1769|nr:response regulator [Zavarzinella formosa]